MKNRQADEVFAAAYGRQKHFLGALGAPFEGCDERLFIWFVSNEMMCSMTQEPRKFGGKYLLVRKTRRQTRARPGGLCLAFFREGSDSKRPGTYDLADADLIIQHCRSGDPWFIELSDGYNGDVLQKLKTRFLRERMSEVSE